MFALAVFVKLLLRLTMLMYFFWVIVY